MPAHQLKIKKKAAIPFQIFFRNLFVAIAETAKLNRVSRANQKASNKIFRFIANRMKKSTYNSVVIVQSNTM